MTAVQLLTDQPIREEDRPDRDGLGFNAYAEVLANAAAGTPGPFTIGIFGEWGTGKTSLMCMINRELMSKSDVVTVWFNAWRYEQEQHPIIPLIATILKGLESHRTVLQKLGDGGKALLRSLRAIAYGFSAKAKVTLPGFPEIEAAFVAKDMIEREDQLSSDPLLDRSLYYEAFERLSKVNVGGVVKIVVLIDDLDRCFPNQAIALLESIKLVLSQPGFVFIIGVSRRVLEGYLQHRYAHEFGISDFEGADYLDKIVQLPFYIPPHRGRMTAFSEGLIQQLQPSDQDALRAVLPIVGVACANNPRTTVRFVNNLLIDKAIHRALLLKGDVQESAEEVPILFFAITRALQQRWWDAFVLLDRSPGLPESVAGWDGGKVREFLDSENPMEAQMAAFLLTDGDLLSLLLIHGRQWLENEKMRRAAVQFLWERRPEHTSSTSEQLKYQIVLLIHSPEDQRRAIELTTTLTQFVPGVMRASTRLMPAVGPDVVVIWVVGSDWEEWESAEENVKKLADRFLQSPLFIVLFPEASSSRVPNLVPQVRTIQLLKEPVQEEDLTPLIHALERLEWTRTPSVGYNDEKMSRILKAYQERRGAGTVPS